MGYKTETKRIHYGVHGPPESEQCGCCGERGEHGSCCYICPPSAGKTAGNRPPCPCRGASHSFRKSRGAGYWSECGCKTFPSGSIWRSVKPVCRQSFYYLQTKSGTPEHWRRGRK